MASVCISPCVSLSVRDLLRDQWTESLHMWGTDRLQGVHILFDDQWSKVNDVINDVLADL